jgi:hypothetical protein
LDRFQTYDFSKDPTGKNPRASNLVIFEAMSFGSNSGTKKLFLHFKIGSQNPIKLILLQLFKKKDRTTILLHDIAHQ